MLLHLRYAELTAKLKNTGVLEIDPTSSDREYLDGFLKVVKDSKEERVVENMKIEVYEFRDANNKVIRIEKAIVKDSDRGKALKIVCKLSDPN
ncbi:MAG: hypothetical protein RMH77_07525 [Sulfolobales archaeon]|nr:hypothetical protein [Sulfolobales archaeon]MCX8186913.1 hypothetical protein [Sulfolobales archaeon]MDW7970228.1 hypothetical protein [Sulfolobales archaeon]